MEEGRWIKRLPTGAKCLNPALLSVRPLFITAVGLVNPDRVKYL